MSAESSRGWAKPAGEQSHEAHKQLQCCRAGLTKPFGVDDFTLGAAHRSMRFNVCPSAVCSCFGPTGFYLTISSSYNGNI